MPAIELVTLFVGISLAQVSPGPNLVAVASCALTSGRGAGMALALGVATGVVIWSLLFALGIGAILDAWPGLMQGLRLIGGGYLLYLGLRALRGAWRNIPPKVSGGGQSLRLSQAWRRGLLVVLTNPKAAMMWVAISVFLAGSGVGNGSFLLVGLGAAFSAAVIYSSYAWLFSAHAMTSGYQRYFRIADGALGAVFAALGLSLLVDALRRV